MSDPSQSESNPENKVQAGAEQPEELSAEELDEVSGAGVMYTSSGTSTTSTSTTPPPPPRTPPPAPVSPGT